MAFKKRYTVSNEDVNTHGFYVSTAGLDITAAQLNCPAYIDHRYWEMPIGHWTDITKEGGEVKATLVIDGENEREREAIRKIENGDMKAASIGADPNEWNDDIAQLKDRQTKPTLSKSELFEISITGLPSNKGALALKRNGQPVTLNTQNTPEIIPDLNPNIDMEKIALALGLSKDATEEQILSAIDANKGVNEVAATLTKELLDKASEGLEAKEKEIFVTLSKANVKQALEYAEGVKALATQDDEEQQAAPTTLKKDVKVSDLIKLGKKAQENAAYEKECFDYLSKHNPVELNRIRVEEPEKYAKLTRDYQKGVRYVGKTA